MIDDLHDFERGRRAPDQAQRLDRTDGSDAPHLRPRRARPWILVGIVTALVAVVVVLLATDDGETDAPIGQPSMRLVG